MLGMGLILTLGSGLGWVASDGLRKRLANNVPAMYLAVWLAVGQLILLLLAAPILIAIGGLGGWSEWRVELSYWQYAVPTFLCTAIGHVLFLRALKVSDLGLTIPYLSFSPIFVLVFAIVFLQEWPTPIALVGLLIVAVGAFFLNPARTNGLTQKTESAGFKQGAVLMLSTAVFWSAAAAFDKAALAHSSFLTHLILLLASTVILLLLTQLVVKPLRTHQGASLSWSVLTVVCLTMLGALALQLGAYVYWDVAYVEAVKRSIGLIGSVVVGTAVFKEANLGKRLIAVVVMAAGTAFIILGG